MRVPWRVPAPADTLLYFAGCSFAEKRSSSLATWALPQALSDQHAVSDQQKHQALNPASPDSVEMLLAMLQGSPEALPQGSGYCYLF